MFLHRRRMSYTRGDWMCVDVGNDLFTFLSIETRDFKKNDVLKVYYNKKDHILLINKEMPSGLYHYKLILSSFPGSYSEVTDIFSHLGINILDTDTATLSEEDFVLEYTVEGERASDKDKEIRENIISTGLLRGEFIEYNVHPLFLWACLKGEENVETANKETSNVQIENSILKLNTTALNKLGLEKNRKYIVFISVYVKVPLIIIHFLEDNPRYRFLKMDLKNAPGVLSAVLKVMRNHCDVLSSKVKYCEQNRARFFVALELLGVNSEEEIVEKDAILRRELENLKYHNENITSRIIDMELSEIHVDIRDTNREIKEAIERHKKCTIIDFPEEKDKDELIRELDQVLQDMDLSIEEIQKIREKISSYKQEIEKV